MMSNYSTVVLRCQPLDRREDKKCRLHSPGISSSVATKSGVGSRPSDPATERHPEHRKGWGSLRSGRWHDAQRRAIGRSDPRWISGLIPVTIGSELALLIAREAEGGLPAAPSRIEEAKGMGIEEAKGMGMGMGVE